MRNQIFRFVRPAAVSLAAAAIAVFAALPAGAAMVSDSVYIISPEAGSVIAGSYDAGGSASGFARDLRAHAQTTCASGDRFSVLRFDITGPGGYEASFDANTSNDPANWTGGPSSDWNTRSIRNGSYTITFTARERQGALNYNCNGHQATDSISVKVANPPAAPAWESAPAQASDGSARVTVQWQRNGEDDIVEYHLVRSGPGGTVVAHVAANPSGACSVSSNVYTCEDAAFTEGGTYTYEIVALRDRPSYNDGESNQINCETASTPCVASRSSEARAVSVTMPAPSPSPTTDPTTPGPTTPPTNNGGGGGGGGPRPSTGGSRPSTGGGSGGGGTYVNPNNFYSGSYQSSLPYQPRTLITGGGSSNSGENNQASPGEVITGEPPDYRTIMLPVAGGLLAFLSAAHVRRLMMHL